APTIRPTERPESGVSGLRGAAAAANPRAVDDRDVTATRDISRLHPARPGRHVRAVPGSSTLSGGDGERRRGWRDDRGADAQRGGRTRACRPLALAPPGYADAAVQSGVRAGGREPTDRATTGGGDRGRRNGTARAAAAARAVAAAGGSDVAGCGAVRATRACLRVPAHARAGGTGDGRGVAGARIHPRPGQAGRVGPGLA